MQSVTPKRITEIIVNKLFQILLLTFSPYILFCSIFYGLIIGIYGSIYGWVERFHLQLLIIKNKYKLFPNLTTNKNINTDIKNIEDEIEKEKTRYQYELGKKKPLNYFTECLQTIIINVIILLPFLILRGIVLGPYNASKKTLNYIITKLKIR